MKKMKILVPIDFSRASFTAYDYAIHLAQDINAEITLIHIVTTPMFIEEPYSESPYAKLIEQAEKRIERFTTEYAVSLGREITKLSYKTEVRFGIPGFTIADYAKDKHFDLVVMVSRVRTGLMDFILGSTSKNVVRLAHCPTLFVHEESVYKKASKIVFAYDEYADLEDALEQYNQINSILTCPTDFIHVNREGEDISESQTEIIEELFEKHNSAYSFTVESIEGKLVADSLLDYTLGRKADMLAVVHRYHGIFDSLFGRSLSFQIARKFHIPVLVLPE